LEIKAYEANIYYYCGSLRLIGRKNFRGKFKGNNFMERPPWLDEFKAELENRFTDLEGKIDTNNTNLTDLQNRFENELADLRKALVSDLDVYSSDIYVPQA
jgi:hypothetical protein